MTISQHRIFLATIKAEGLPEPTAEYRFDAVRRWRFDYAWPENMVALEVEGGIYSHGRHVRGKGYLNDMHKYNAATIAGWRVLRVTPQELLLRSTSNQLRQLITTTGERANGTVLHEA